MLDQELIQAWKKITPSSELEHKILQMSTTTPTLPAKQRKVLRLKPLMTMAACLALLLGSVLTTAYMQRASRTEILLSDGSAIGSHAVSVLPETVDYASSPMAARAISEEPIAHGLEQTAAAIRLRISSSEKVSLTVEEGILYVESAEDGVKTYVPAGHSVTDLESGMEILWILPTSDLDEDYIMTMGQDTICVTYRAQTNEYFISRTNAGN